ncbi:MAG TPA: TIGR01777 family oxidoreductase [Mycobacteriales bacterium]|nr:TIGR01777 family oxidoreductase [Mycobacteriales bacterium]
MSTVRIAITGARGLIGSALVPALEGVGHTVVPLVRRTPRAGEVGWDPARRQLNPADLSGTDAVIHLAGAGIGDRRWTPAYKRTLLDSRVDGTTTLSEAIAAAEPRPPVLLSSSAIGWYGDTGDRAVDESAPAGSDFLGDLCRRWEEATRAAADAGVRVVHLRTGLVCAGKGGLLGRLLPLFRLCLGGKLGTGKQYWSWISLADEISAIQHLLDSDVSGPVNLTGPEPVTNAEFTKVLGRVLGRPTLAPVPAFALRIAVGEFADVGVLTSQRVLPKVLESSAYPFQHSTVEATLRWATGRD